MTITNFKLNYEALVMINSRITIETGTFDYCIEIENPEVTVDTQGHMFFKKAVRNAQWKYYSIFNYVSSQLK